MNARFPMLVALLLLVLVSACGGNSGTPTPTPTSTVTLTGTAAVGAADLSLVATPAEVALAKSKSIPFLTKADAVASGFDVSLYKISADGTEEQVSGVTATTDASGAYTLSDVPVATTGTGAATDFYYEVRATNGTLEIKAPTAPSADTTVNASPETKIAANLLTNVAQIPETGTPSVLPEKEAIEHVREMVAADVDEMTTFTPPSTSTAAEANVTIAAEAVSSNNRNSEKLRRMYELQQEAFYILQNKANLTTGDIASYLDRVTKAGCDFDSNMVLPQSASVTLATKLAAGSTYTVSEVVDAFNISSTTPDVTSDEAIAHFRAMQDALSTAFADKSDLSSINSENLIALYVDRGDLTSLAADTALQIDQALAMVQAMLPTGNRCQGSRNFDYVSFVASLTDNDAMDLAPVFSDIEVYSQRFGSCTDAALRARVEVFLPHGVTVNIVSIAASGMTDTNGVSLSSVHLTQSDPNIPVWEYGTSDAQQACLAFGTAYEFTLTADFEGADDLSVPVLRTIVNLPEATITLVANYTETTQFSTGQPADPVAISDERPMFKWIPAPGTPSADLGAPDGSKIRYLYDITHFSRSDGGYAGTGAPENGDLVNCPGEQNNTRLYDKNYILSPIDCDVDRCDAALGSPSGQHVCRLHVQTLLVDEYDRPLNYSAGADMYFCIIGQTNCTQ